MDALPLPPTPSLENYRKRAGQLLKARESAEAGAVRSWASDWLGKLREQVGIPLTPFVQGSLERAVDRLAKHIENRAEASLADAQFVIAQAHGFGSWAAFAGHIDDMNSKCGVSTFEQAADAMVNGDIDALRALIAGDPLLARARSTREHHVTLLHYVAANGVEDFRQKSPKNAVAIATLLLDAGAEVDAAAETYGGGAEQTTMTLLVSSTHPAGAGVQVPLVELLLDRGAAVNGVTNGGAPLEIALMFGYLPAAATLVRRGARIDNLVTAAAFGPLSQIEAMLDGEADPNVSYAGFPPVQAAAAFGRLDAVDLLVRRGASLQVENMYGGTAVGCAMHYREGYGIPGVDYTAVIAHLRQMGGTE